MIDPFEAHKMLVKNGFEVLKNSPYKIPIVLNARYDAVEYFLREWNYQGSFGVINEKKGVKGD